MVDQWLEAPAVLALKDIVQLTPAVQQPLASVAVFAVALARGSCATQEVLVSDDCKTIANERGLDERHITLLAELFRNELFAAVDFLGCGGALRDFRWAERVGNHQKLRRRRQRNVVTRCTHARTHAHTPTVWRAACSAD